LSAAVGAVGTVEKRSLFFHGFHGPVFWLVGSNPQSSALNSPATGFRR
jgi:hypothetical protein